jgi:hypothetical protein
MSTGPDDIVEDEVDATAGPNWQDRINAYISSLADD